MFSRLGSCEIQGGGILLFNDHLKPGADVVQLCGEENCGKTEVLLNIIADTILPDQWNEIRLPGRNLAVIFISTDHKFDLLRLVCIMENKLRNCIEKQKFKNSKRLPSIEEQKSLVISSLERCHVFKTSSHDELFSTVNWLGTFLQQVMNVCVIAIDNIAAYYWIERSKQGPIEFESSQKSMVNSLRKLQHHHSVVLYFTTPSLMAGNSVRDFSVLAMMQTNPRISPSKNNTKFLSVMDMHANSFRDVSFIG